MDGEVNLNLKKLLKGVNNMPNWCEGTLKVRGIKENVTKFVLEGLQPVGFLGEDRGKLTLNKWGDIESDETCWIENTRRGFVDKPCVYLPDCEDGEIMIIALDARFAWGITATELQKTCIKYNVDMKIYAFERGMEFNQDIEIVDGQIIKDEEISFEGKDYTWECICPNMGG